MQRRRQSIMNIGRGGPWGGGKITEEGHLVYSVFCYLQQNCVGSKLELGVMSKMHNYHSAVCVSYPYYGYRMDLKILGGQKQYVYSPTFVLG